jgi:hypothetical protein
MVTLVASNRHARPVRQIRPTAPASAPRPVRAPAPPTPRFDDFAPFRDAEGRRGWVLAKGWLPHGATLRFVTDELALTDRIIQAGLLAFRSVDVDGDVRDVLVELRRPPEGEEPRALRLDVFVTRGS